MPKGDHCAVFGCSNDRRYPEKQIVKPHVGVLRFYSPLNVKDASKWEKLINRRDFKVKLSTKVSCNLFTTCNKPVKLTTDNRSVAFLARQSNTKI